MRKALEDAQGSFDDVDDTQRGFLGSFKVQKRPEGPLGSFEGLCKNCKFSFFLAFGLRKCSLGALLRKVPVKTVFFLVRNAFHLNFIETLMCKRISETAKSSENNFGAKMPYF